VTTADLIAMQRAARRSWTVDSHRHIGDLAWQWPDRVIEMWRDAAGGVVAWSWLTPPGHLEPHAPPALIPSVLRWFDEAAGPGERPARPPWPRRHRQPGLTAGVARGRRHRRRGVPRGDAGSPAPRELPPDRLPGRRPHRHLSEAGVNGGLICRTVIKHSGHRGSRW
jgi:hypothetical protein